MTSRKLAAMLVLAFATSAAGGSSRHDADVLVALGAGVAGTWETEFEFANPDSDIAVTVFAGEQPHPFVCVTSPCGIAYAPLPRSGSARIVTRSSDFGAFTGRLFVGADDAEELPTVKARVINRARPSQGIELPLFRRSTLVALNPLVLSFPGVERSAASHTNLFVSEIGLSAGIDVLIEAYASTGERLGQEVRSLAAGQTLFLQDVLPRLNAAELSEGQIRLTRTNNGGVMWGLAATVFDDGHVTVTAGKHP
jgi:hypothetical protein